MKRYPFIAPHRLSSAWFFTNAHPLLQAIGIYVRGDALVLVPFLVFAGVVASYSLRAGLLLLSLYYACRGLGELIYWLLQQFGPKTYRPYDYGLTGLNNDAIYVLYQLKAMLSLILGTAAVLLVLF